MSLYTVLVFVALAFLGALIAYLGDLIGVRVGKRRSSIFGLRPRQSARLVAAIIGGLLPLLGLGVATVGSRYARAAVFELRSLLDRQKQLTARVETLQEDVERYEERVTEAEARAEQAEADARELKGILEDQRGSIEALQSTESELRDRAGELQERVQGLTERRRELTENLSDARDALEQSRVGLRAAEESLEFTEEELEAKRAEVEQKEQQVENIGLELERIGDELRDVNRQLDPAKRYLIATSEELAAREQELRELEQRLQQVMSHQELVSQRPDVLFEPWDELLRVVQEADRTQDQVEADLFEWLHLASAVVERSGVPEGPNGRAVVLEAPTPEGFEPGEAPERQIVRHVASQLRTAGPDEWVVMVRVYRRYFRGDNTQVAVAFKATPNRLEFTEGDVLDEFVVSSQIDELNAITTLWHRIADDDSAVRARAIAEGMLPRPNTSSYGSTDLESIYHAAQRIRAGDGQMLVQLKAAGDTYTRGPLELEIDVRPTGEAR
ncbi:MAG: DUF3084 domain-containing protein [Armatimonadia bacterium]|nr:DUF3084 domain-containing protein [Armatimonadia bacterium]